MNENDPTIVRRELGRVLRKVREQAGKSVADVARTKVVSKATLCRYESGRAPADSGKVVELAMLYGLDLAAIKELQELAVGSRQLGWWEDHGKVAATHLKFFIGLETAASQVQTYVPDLVPGLLQTEDYVRAVERASMPAPDEQTLERRVAVRMRRQQALFGRSRPFRLRAVMGPGALARQVGGPEVMAAQVTHLGQMAKHRRVELRVLPWAAGAHAALAGSFTLMRCDDPDDPPVVHVDTAVGSSYFERPEQVERYQQIFGNIYDRSEPMEEQQP
jgi:transcriptional regulator with XRE-family HTH domain